jgi:putative transposase
MARDNSPQERQQKQLARKQGRRASYDRILIVSEGSKTEPNYFREIRAAYRLHTANVEVRPSELGTAPIQVVQPNYTFRMQRLQAFKFELMPDGRQERQMRRFAGLPLRVQPGSGAAAGQPPGRGKFIGYVAMAKYLTAWRNSSATAWLADAPVHPQQQALKDLERAYQNFFAKRSKFPRFKRHGTVQAFATPTPSRSSSTPPMRESSCPSSAGCACACRAACSERSRASRSVARAVAGTPASSRSARSSNPCRRARPPWGSTWAWRALPR